MFDLTEKHAPVHDCDCLECALAERARLRLALKRANSLAEQFERDWYLRGDLVDDLAMLVRRLAHSQKKLSPNSSLAKQAVDYLKQHDLQGSPMRTKSTAIS